MNVKVTYLNQICRMCLKFVDDPHQINELCELHEPSIISLVKECLSIQICLNEELLSKICRICLEKLEQFSSFKQNCARNELFFKEYNGKINEIFDYQSFNVTYNRFCAGKEFKRLDGQKSRSQPIQTQSNLKNGRLSLKSTENSKYVICLVCDRKVRGQTIKSHLKIHQLTHRVPLTDKSECQSTAANCHRKITHSNTLSSTFKHKRDSQLCPICGVVKKNHLDVHISQLHSQSIEQKSTVKKTSEKKNNPKIITCPKCHIQMSRTSLKRHITTVHERLRNFKCVICQGRVRDRARLKVHMRKHTDERPFPCPYCTHAFRQKYTLNAHLATHTGEKPYTCAKCQKSFLHLNDLKVHLSRYHVDVSLTCHSCDKTFMTPKHFLRHVRVVHNNDTMHLEKVARKMKAEDDAVAVEECVEEVAGNVTSVGDVSGNPMDLWLISVGPSSNR